MELNEWAKREVEIACDDMSKKAMESKDEVDKEAVDYAVGCYKSALKAFESLCEDGHSGMSIGFTKNILNRLIDGRPLAPIEESDDIWNGPDLNYREGKVYQCKRMFSLFKTVYDDGRVEYRDNDRIVCVEKKTGFTCYAGHIDRKVEGIYIPNITLPYEPFAKPYYVYFDEFDIKDEVSYTGIYYCVSPLNKTVIIDEYYKRSNDGEVKITKEEFEEKFAEYNNISNQETRMVKEKEND